MNIRLRVSGKGASGVGERHCSAEGAGPGGLTFDNGHELGCAEKYNNFAVLSSVFSFVPTPSFSFIRLLDNQSNSSSHSFSSTKELGSSGMLKLIRLRSVPSEVSCGMVTLSIEFNYSSTSTYAAKASLAPSDSMSVMAKSEIWIVLPGRPRNIFQNSRFCLIGALFLGFLQLLTAHSDVQQLKHRL